METATLKETRILAGRPFPLGATLDQRGVNFALFSDYAERVELVLFDGPDAKAPSETVPLVEQTGPIWHLYIRGLKAGQHYGYRVHGPYHPEQGHRFNPSKVLLDPYAKQIGRDIRWHDSLFAYRFGDPKEDLSYNSDDSAPHAPLGVVIDPRFEWGKREKPHVPWRDTVIYEAHVKGISKLHPDVPEGLRGTYLGLCSEPIVEHLKSLGVTTVQLLPVHAFAKDRHLLDRKLTNYWGYNTLNFFSPEPSYAANGGAHAVREFKQMVKTLHRAGFEVIMDVVYNHTAEGNRLGPTLSFRGIDSWSYYKETPHSKRYYMDYTGTGNTLDLGNPHVLQLVMDSLRYWVLEMRVDGFRFDLASVLARELYDVDMLSPFFQVIQQDPVLSQVKLIAEPWDVGPGGYQVGGFPWQWAEWNGRYRDAVRSFWKGDTHGVGEVATRVSGSSDLYGHSGRRPHSSVNFITAHDGFTLQDLVSYEHKHNQANGEQNRDGHDDNRSSNCGVEGPTDDPEVLLCRERRKRSLAATLVLSLGVPMLLGGDELSKTQQGNNNAYCQDNELNWYDWNLDDRRAAFLRFLKKLIRLRRKHPTFRRRHFLTGTPDENGERDVSWWHPAGRELSEADWSDGGLRTIGMLLDGDTVRLRTKMGHPVVDQTFLILLNAGGDVSFALPAHPDGKAWELALTTEPGGPEKARYKPGQEVPLPPLSVVVLQAAGRRTKRRNRR